MMPSLTEVLNHIGDDKLKVQYLHDSTVKIVDKKKTQDTEITFATDAVDCSTFYGGNKTALIVWLDVEDYNNATKVLKEVE